MGVPQVKEFSKIESKADVTYFLEMRMENDANGNPIYIGYSKTPNAGTAAALWYIVMVTYDANQSPTHQQLPNAGVQFTYVWDDRATYF